MVAVWCPDWPVTAALRASAEVPQARRHAAGASWREDAATYPVAVLKANRVVACSQPARAQGIRRGQRRRDAQARCPELVLLARDEAAEIRIFEPVVSALESVAAGVEVTRPGLAAIAAHGPARYFGGEPELVRVVSQVLAQHPEGRDVMIGVADGSFAAEQAARQGIVVSPGESPEFLSAFSIDVLAVSSGKELVDVLKRLGLRTLGAFAALPAREVLERFGAVGALAHCLASGHDARPLSARRVPPEYTVTIPFDTPVDRADELTFSCRRAAEKFITELAAAGHACACLEVQVGTDGGEELSRRWRHTSVMNANDVLDRLRWQLEGWLSNISGGVVRVAFVPIDTVPIGLHQQVLWGGAADIDERVQRGLARVQTLLGYGSVLTPMLQGGRSSVERTGYGIWGDAAIPEREPEQPWPGRLPSPAPSVLLDPPRRIAVLDDVGRPVLVSERGVVVRPPVRMVVDTDQSVGIQQWAGPWPVDERWWSSELARRAARFQLVTTDGRAYLAVCEVNTDSVSSPTQSTAQWWLEGIYD